MDAADHLLNDRLVNHNLEEDQLLPSGVKCDLVNECKIFIKAEDGSGDAHVNATNIMMPEQSGNVTFHQKYIHYFARFISIF